MYYYNHHIGDFIRDTSNLDDHQLATYLRMIWSYYATESQLTLNIEDIAFAMRSDEKTVRLLLRHFFMETPTGWAHKRCDKEIAEYKLKSEKARNSANARWKNANALRTQTERNANEAVIDANQEPITNNQHNTPLLSPQGGEPKAKPPEDARSVASKSENQETPAEAAGEHEIAAPTSTHCRQKKNDSKPLPDVPGLDYEVWERWKKYRKEIRKPIKAPSMGKAMEGLADYGADQGAVVDQSIAFGYTGLFPLKNKPRQTQSRHNGFSQIDYLEGIDQDGRF